MSQDKAINLKDLPQSPKKEDTRQPEEFIDKSSIHKDEGDAASELIPVNTKGKETDLDHSVSLPDKEQALDCFRRAYKRLLNPPVWHELSGALSADFVLTDEKGEELERLLLEGDYIRINIPGPGNATGDGYDWVKVETVEDKTNADAEEERLGIKVRACDNPTNANNNTAHFFKSDATSSFIIHRNGNTVTASYHGRNEVPNTKTDKTTDNVRNAMVATGAIAGLSELQWSALIKGFLSEEIGGT